LVKERGLFKEPCYLSEFFVASQEDGTENAVKAYALRYRKHRGSRDEKGAAHRGNLAIDVLMMPLSWTGLAAGAEKKNVRT
jgi:hypothetical protein